MSATDSMYAGRGQPVMVVEFRTSGCRCLLGGVRWAPLGSLWATLCRHQPASLRSQAMRRPSPSAAAVRALKRPGSWRVAWKPNKAMVLIFFGNLRRLAAPARLPSGVQPVRTDYSTLFRLRCPQRANTPTLQGQRPRRQVRSNVAAVIVGRVVGQNLARAGFDVEDFSRLT
jgi:hypothetical protein